jgi:hypothetical protein
VRDIYLGDSFDLIKRFWFDSLLVVAPLYAHPRFVPVPIRAQYTAVTSIHILDTEDLPQKSYGVLLDPHTGIPLPDEAVGEATASHAPLPFIVRECERLQPAYMVCFDQSHYRRHDLSRDEQKKAKREFLRRRGIASFYYISHAPFLFMAKNPVTLGAVRDRLISLGIPVETPATIRLQAI